ncbi:hypothetical protein [Bradyrhizobium oligotrophicum]|uniref:hypothetical protein n=1 Tax=Bradyrhizobium oligotrophicum TaxID=44255 RepID=UPI003EBFD0A6
MTEGQKYIRFMRAFDGLAQGKGLRGQVVDKDNYGRIFDIDALLAHTRFDSRLVFDESDIPQVKAAFVRVRKRYPSNSINECVEALLR